ncbi:MAG: amino acid ABC transporter substrate-binding protein [Bacillota bacterium]|nr:amino acid ABC transporter substrate-binding protein [Bacillota bacterium]
MKKICYLAFAIALLLGISACSGGENKEKATQQDAENAEKSTYIVGFDNTFAPMGFEKDGENMGFDIDLAKKMEEKLGVSFQFQAIDWTLKETELESKNIDMIWNGYSITEDRKAKVLFSDPYMDNRILILVKKDSEIMKKSDLKGKTVSTQDQSSSLDALNADEISKDLQDIITYASFNDVFSDLKTERSDAIVVDETLGLYYITTAGETDNFRVLDEDLGSEEYAVGFRKEDEAFVKEFNLALKELKEKGEVQKIYDKWFKGSIE